MRLYFNHNTKSIIAKHKDYFYDMRNGRVICHTSLSVEYGIVPSPLKPFNKEFTTKLINNSEFVEKMKKLAPCEQIEFGYRFRFGKNELYVTLEGNQFRLSGKFPYYFLKSITKFINNIR